MEYQLLRIILVNVVFDFQGVATVVGSGWGGGSEADVEQVKDSLLLVVGGGLECDLGLVEDDGFLPDAFQSFQYAGEGPTAVLAFAVLLKQRSQPLLHVPLDVVGQHAEEHVGLDPFVFVVVGNT